MYSEKVMEHFQNPRNMGEIEDPDGVGDVGNPKCGDMMRLTLKIDPGTQTITDIKFKTFGCGAAIATSSMITELVKGKTLDEALQVSNKTVVEALGGLPPVKMHCSVLAEQGIAAAMIDYFKRHPEQTPPPGLLEKAARLEKLDPHGWPDEV
jgi:nitrogen fixation NifU-like protein